MTTMGRIVAIVLLSGVAQAHAQTPPEVAASGIYRLERDVDDKKDEVKVHKVTRASLNAIKELLSQASAKTGQLGFPPDFEALLKDLADSVGKVNSRESVSQWVSKLHAARRKYASVTESLYRVVDPDDAILSAEEKKILRPLLGSLPHDSSPHFARLMTFDFPGEQLFEIDPSLVKIFPGFPKTFNFSEPGLKTSLEEISQQNFKLQREEVVKSLAQMQKQVEQQLADTDKIIQQLQDDIEKLSERIDKTRERGSKVDQALVYFALPGLAILMLGLLIAPRIYRDEQLHMEVFKSGLLLELFTVFFITATILILGLGGKIDGPILGTLLGGIAGYVLGRAGSRAKQIGEADRRTIT